MKRIADERGRDPGVRRLGGSPIESGSQDEMDASRHARLLRRPLQGTFLIPLVLPVVLIPGRTDLDGNSPTANGQ
jgi:hypothetical protein